MYSVKKSEKKCVMKVKKSVGGKMGLFLCVLCDITGKLLCITLKPAPSAGYNC